MQVNIKFDTEKESVDDLKRLVNSLQELIAQREKNPTPTNTIPNMQLRPMTTQSPQPQPKPSGTQTSGGGRIMEYDPAIGDLLSKFASGSKY